MKIGDAITIWGWGMTGYHARPAWVQDEIGVGPDAIYTCELAVQPRYHRGSTALRVHVHIEAEGIEWLPGHGPEIEAALDAARWLIDDEPTLPFLPRPSTVILMPCGTNSVVLGALVEVGPTGAVQAATGGGPVLGHVTAVYQDNTVAVLIDSTAAVNSAPCR